MILSEFLQKNKPTILYIILTILTITFITSGLTNHIRIIRSFFIYFVSAIYVPANEILEYPLDLSNKLVKIIYLSDENKKLKEQIDNLQIYKLKYEELLQDFEAYKNVIHNNFINEYQIIFARVIDRNYTNWFNNIIISVGRNNGVAEEMPVLIQDQTKKLYLIGRIWQVEENISKVILISDQLSSIPAKVKGKSVQGIVVGTGGKNLLLEYVLPEDKINIGDIVVTSGLLENIPENIEIGVVVNTQLSNTDGFLQIEVKPTFNLNNIREVIIYRSKK